MSWRPPRPITTNPFTRKEYCEGQTKFYDDTTGRPKGKEKIVAIKSQYTIVIATIILD